MRRRRWIIEVLARRVDFSTAMHLLNSSSSAERSSLLAVVAVLVVDRTRRDRSAAARISVLRLDRSLEELDDALDFGIGHVGALGALELGGAGRQKSMSPRPTSCRRPWYRG
jgi:hypothetical protein